jgi:hypothetical protein
MVNTLEKTGNDDTLRTCTSLETKEHRDIRRLIEKNYV